MTLGEIKNEVMFQTNNDAEDVGDFLPALTDYINDGYDRLVNVWAGEHVDSESADWPPLRELETAEEPGPNIPKTPEWTHRYLADWATWLVYRNGNPQKQQRGYAFRENFLNLLSRIADEGGINGLNEDGTRKKYKNFYNIPR